MGKATRQAYGEALADLVKEHEDIVVVDADLSGSTKTALAKKVDPSRHFNIGIAEANMIGVAAGLASSGYTVFASSFAMFATGRPWEQIRNSLAYPNLKVKVCGTHSGIAVGEDGVSHQATEDIAIMHAIPNMKIYCPCDEVETKAVIKHIYNEDGPCYVRLGRSEADDLYANDEEFDFTKVKVLNKGKDVCIFATGLMVQESMYALKKLQEEGINPTIVDVCSIKPLDEEGVKELLNSHEHIITVEEHNVIGGLGSAISDVSVKYCPRLITKIGMQDEFGQSGPFKDLLKLYGLHHDNIVKTVKEAVKKPIVN